MSRCVRVIAERTTAAVSELRLTRTPTAVRCGSRAAAVFVRSGGGDRDRTRPAPTNLPEQEAGRRVSGWLAGGLMTPPRPPRQRSIVFRDV